MVCLRWILIAIVLARGLCVGQSQPSASDKNPQTTAPQRDEIDILAHPTASPDMPGLRTSTLPQIRTPNYVTLPVADLQKTVRELQHLKAAGDQSQLIPLLNKMGAKTIEIARNTPNLISHEAVVSEFGGAKQRQDFSYLVLQHLIGQDAMVFDEYRIDLANGEKYQTEGNEKGASQSKEPPQMELPSPAAMPPSRGAPQSQGFVNAWVHFYPPNRFQSDFRYLGEQKMDGHQTLVVSFAQKPGTLRLPATIEYANKTYPLYLQGIAWVDASDYRIVRLRTDILFPPPGVPVRQFTADIRFEEVRLTEIATPLWLPRQVVVVSNTGASALKESHVYTNYRLFRAKSKLLLNQ